ncbi:UbiA family prenyltransferase [soil metagenome]
MSHETSRRGTFCLLVRASHPEPTVAVTALATALAWAADVSPRSILFLAVAVVAGQLSVGWSNDLLDAERDREVRRLDKPVATGALTRSTVRGAIVGALVVAVAASLGVGLRPGLLHLGLVAVGWLYNLGLKRTLLSWLPYAVCFGLMPAVVTLAQRDPAFAPAWMITAGALLGVAAHLLNAVPDLAEDLRTGVCGFPHVLGTRASTDLATLLMVAGSVVAVVGPPGAVGASGYVALIVVGCLVVAGRLGRGLDPFRTAMAIAAVVVIALVLQS